MSLPVITRAAEQLLAKAEAEIGAAHAAERKQLLEACQASAVPAARHPPPAEDAESAAAELPQPSSAADAAAAADGGAVTAAGVATDSPATIDAAADGVAANAGRSSTAEPHEQLSQVQPHAAQPAAGADNAAATRRRITAQVARLRAQLVQIGAAVTTSAAQVVEAYGPFTAKAEGDAVASVAASIGNAKAIFSAMQEQHDAWASTATAEAEALAASAAAAAASGRNSAADLALIETGLAHMLASNQARLNRVSQERQQ